MKRSDRFAIFWGGGLGDALALRPLLLALEPALDAAPRLFTTATHLPTVFSDLGLRVELQVLPVRPAKALRFFRDLGMRFERLYLGPYPRIKTRMLGFAVAPGRVWSVRHSGISSFVSEQVQADVLAMGLEVTDAIRQPYGGRWRYPDSGDEKGRRGHLVLHPGAKERWETTRWPEAHWKELLLLLSVATPMELVLVGSPAERPSLEILVAPLPAAAQARIRLSTNLNLGRLARLVDTATGVICHNSGVLHLAAMLGKPTVALTGSSANFWRPPYPHVINITSGACDLACNQYRCPIPFYQARCIRRLEVQAVMDTVMMHLRLR